MRLAASTFMAALCVVVSAAALDVPLEYERFPDSPGMAYRPHARTVVGVSVEQPPGDWKLPELVSDASLYALVKQDDADRLLVLDRRSKDDAFFTRLYFDVNGNRDLTDDSPINSDDGSSGDLFFSAHFEPIDYQIAVDGKRTPYCLRVSASLWLEDGQEKVTAEFLETRCPLMVDVNCAYRGEFSLDGTTYYVWLADADANGRFDGRASAGSLGSPAAESPAEAQQALLRGDQIYLTTTRGIGYHDSMALGKWLSLGGRLYEVTIDIPGKKLSLTPATVPMGRAKLPMETERLALLNRDSDHSVMLFRPGRAAMIPEGTYGVMGYCALRNDEQGDLWRVTASVTAGTPFVEVKGARGAPLTFGEPFIPQTGISGGQRDGIGNGLADAEIFLNVKGAANEQVRDISHIQGLKTKIPLSGNYPKEARFKIVKPDGEVAAQGKFDYG